MLFHHYLKENATYKYRLYIYYIRLILILVHAKASISNLLSTSDINLDMLEFIAKCHLNSVKDKIY